MGDKNLLTFSTKFNSHSSFVKIKKGKRAGATAVPHTIIPFKHASKLEVGFIIKSAIKITIINEKNKFCFFDKFKLFYLKLC